MSSCKNCKGNGYNMVFDYDLMHRVPETCSVCGGSGIEPSNSIMDKSEVRDNIFYVIVIILCIIAGIICYFTINS